MKGKLANLIAARRGAGRSWPISTRFLFLIPLFALALFLAKPFHIDDVTFVKMGEALPWTIIGTDAHQPSWFLGRFYPQLSPYESTHPVLLPYFLKWIGILQGDGEPNFFIYHFFFLVFPALILFFSLLLARVRKLSPHWSWYLVFSPIFFVNATNLMIDIAMLAFWMGAVFMAIAWVEGKDRRYGIGSAVCLTAALLTSYQSVALFPLLGAFFAIRGNVNKQSLMVLGVPALVFMVYLLAVYAVSGFFPFLSSGLELNIAEQVGSGMGLKQYIHKIFATLVFLGFGLFFVTPLVLTFISTRRFIIFMAMSLVYSVALLRFGREYQVLEGYDSIQSFVIWLLVLNATFWVWLMAAKMVDGVVLLWRKRRVRAAYLLTACFWFMGVLVYNVVFMPYGTARYVLPALPGALMIIFIKSHYRRFQNLEAVLLACSLLLSLFMARVDYQQARADFQLYEMMKTRQPVGDLWYSDDAGLSRYMPLIDAHYLSLDSDLPPVGDQVLVTRGLIPDQVSSKLSLVEEYHLPTFMGWSLFDTQANAGFYRSYDGLLPMWRAPVVSQAWLLEVDFFRKMRDRAVTLDLSHPDYFGFRNFEMPGGDKKSVMFMHPDATIGFWLPKGRYRLTGNVLTDPASWEREGDGVDCIAGIRMGKEDHVLWQTAIDGKNNSDHRVPKDFQIDLPENATMLWFKVTAGSAGDYRYDGMGWGDLRLIPLNEE